MKIEIEISEENESTSYPWWIILRPIRENCYVVRSKTVVSDITGPFFSREEAEIELDSRRHYYGRQAVVWCLSGCNSGQYKCAIDDANKVGSDENR